MNVRFLDVASREFLAACRYYESQQAGLGDRLADELDRAVRWLGNNPHALAARRGRYRRLNLHIFPYYIAYAVRDQTLWIVAVAHARRKPEYWIKRTKEIDR